MKPLNENIYYASSPNIENGKLDGYYLQHQQQQLLSASMENQAMASLSTGNLNGVINGSDNSIYHDKYRFSSSEYNKNDINTSFAASLPQNLLYAATKDRLYGGSVTTPISTNYNDIIKEYPSSMEPILNEMLGIMKNDNNGKLILLTLTKLFETVLVLNEKVLENAEKSKEITSTLHDKLNKMEKDINHNFEIINKVQINGNNVEQNVSKLNKKLSSLKFPDNNKKMKEYNKNVMDINKQLNLMNNNNEKNLLNIKKKLVEIKEGIQENKRIIFDTAQSSIKVHNNNGQQLIDGLNKYKTIIHQMVKGSNQNIIDGINSIQRNIIAEIKQNNDDIASVGISGAVARQRIKDMIEEVSAKSTPTAIKYELEKESLSMVLNKDIIISSTSSEIIDNDESSISEIDDLKEGNDKKDNVILIQSQTINNDGVKKKEAVKNKKNIIINKKIKKFMEIKDKEDLAGLSLNELNELLVEMKNNNNLNLNMEDVKNEILIKKILNERDKD